jgi:surface antigen
MLLACGVVAAGGLLCVGCSADVKMSGSPATDQPVQTGSILNPPSPEGSGLPPASDLAYAKVAAAEVMRSDSKDASLPWENPHSGARGTVTPIASAYRVDGELCRDFIASHVTEGTERWMQGEACRASRGEWEVRRLKAWRRS